MKWDEAPALSPDIAAVRQVESGGNASAVSPKGAQGLMQVMPATNTQPGYGVVPARDNSEAERTRVGEDYLSALQKKYGREDGLRAYNWGPGNYEKWVSGGRDATKMPKETADYVPKVNKAGGTKMASWMDAPIVQEEPAPSGGGASQIPNEVANQPPLPPEPPGVLQRAKAAAGRLVDQAQTKEGWKAAGQGALNTVLDAPNAAVTAAGKLYAPAVGAVQDAINGNPLGTGNTQIQQGMDQFSQDTARDPNSLGYKGTQVATEVAGTAGPLTRATGVLAGPGASTLGRVAADVGVNAGYSGGRSALEGKGITDVLADAAMGGTGAAAAHGITGIVGGAKSALPEARRLMVERGGLPSAGQIFGGPVEAAERGFGNVPILGRAMGISGEKGAINDSLKSFSTADVNRALEGTKLRIKTSGETGVAEAVKGVNDQFATLVPQTRIGGRAANKAIIDGLQDTLGKNIPTSSQRWQEALRVIDDETHILTRRMGYTDGRVVQDVLSNLSRLERDSLEHNPELARVARTVKNRIRDGLTPIPGAPNSVTADLKAANTARAKLYPMEDAARMAGARGGHFTPAESFEAQAAGGKSPVDDVMNRGGRDTQLMNRPDSDKGVATKAAVAATAATLGLPYGKAMLGGLATGAPLAVTSLAGGLGGLGAARLANTRAGRKLLLEGLAGGLPEGGIRKILQSQEAAQLAAQAGRAAATD